ncbi:MAG: cytochrome c oxidase subunit II [Actinomycetota bacterium]|nr:cytochrome c oxidase subunit II [Actinomycetota bacterium]
MLVALLVAGCDRVPRMGFPNAITPQGREILGLWKGSWIAAALVGAFVWGLMLWAGFVYRRRKDTDIVPDQVRYNLPIELLYTAVPLVVVAFLFVYTARTETYVDKLSANPPVKIGVVGFQWNWQFNYLDKGVQITGRPGTPAQLVIPSNRKIRFIESSPDVNHSFFVPSFLFKRDVIPGRQNQFEITVEKEGTYVGRCAEFCGVDHDRMNFSVRVVSPQEYDAFLAKSAAGSASAAGGSPVSPTPGSSS